MPTTDFSRVSDEVLEDVFNRLFDNPNLIPNVEERRAWVAERNRRAAGGTRKPDNVEASLEASAAPIPPDADLRPRAPRGPLARGVRAPMAGGDRVPDNAEDQRVFDVGGSHGVPGPVTDDGRPARLPQQFGSASDSAEYYVRPRDPVSGALRPSQADIDMRARGFEPVYTPDGEISYRPAAATDNLGRVRDDMSPRAIRQANYWAGESAADGSTVQPLMAETTVRGPFGPVRVLAPTPATRAANDQRADAQMMSRLYEAAGIPEPVGGQGKQYTADELRAMGRNRRSADLADRKQAVVRMRQAQTNPLEYLGRADIDDWQRMAVAERYLREPQRMTPLGVQAVGAQNAMRMMNADAFAGGLPGALETRETIRRTQRMEELRGVAGQAANNSWGSPREDAEQALIGKGATRTEREAVLNDMFGPDRNEAVPSPAPGAGPPSQSQYYPGQPSAPPPRNPLAAPRPFG